MRFTVQARLNEYVKQTINDAAVGESPTAALYTVFSFYTKFSALLFRTCGIFVADRVTGLTARRYFG